MVWVVKDSIERCNINNLADQCQWALGQYCSRTERFGWTVDVSKEEIQCETNQWIRICVFCCFSINSLFSILKLNDAASFHETEPTHSVSQNSTHWARFQRKFITELNILLTGFRRRLYRFSSSFIEILPSHCLIRFQFRYFLSISWECRKSHYKRK